MIEELRTTTSAAVQSAASPAVITPVAGARKNGKQWKPAKQAFRPRAGASKSWETRVKERKAMETVKAREKKLKDEKEAARQARATALKQKREAQGEKERYAKLAEKMHAKRVERLKRREKRNKALKER